MKVNKVKNKTRQLIIRIIVILLVIAMIFALIVPLMSVSAKTKYTTYNNKALKASVKIPSSSKSKVKKLSQNSVEIPINNNLLIRVTYGDIYEETLKSKNLSQEDVNRRNLYIESDYFKDTWNDKKYIKKYFDDILSSDKRVSYKFEIKKSKLSDLPAWECKYKNKRTVSSGYYYLTAINGGLYILQFDSYMKNISNYNDTKNLIKKSYKINNKVFPLTPEEEIEEQKAKEEVRKKSEATKGSEFLESSINFVVIGIGVLIVGYFVFYLLSVKKSKMMKERRKKIREEKKDD